MNVSIWNFENNSSKAMNVNGSVTPVVFKVTATQDCVITSVSCVLKDDGTTSLSNFGAIQALSNGILIRSVINSENNEITTIKDNADLSTRFNFNHYGNGAVLSILGIVTAQGFGSSNNIFVGSMNTFYPGFSDKGLKLRVNDTIEVLIRDNLTNIDVLNMSCTVICE